jgi:hypothetical protein
MTVEEYIAAEAKRPFIIAVTDCAAMCDRWVALRTGKSVFSLAGVNYATQEEATKLASHLPARINRAMRVAGFQKTADPQIGDVGIAIFDGRLGPAIHAGTHWITRHNDGFIAAPIGNFWKAWRI